MVHGIIIATMLTLVGDNGSGDQVAAPPQPPSHPAQVSMGGRLGGASVLLPSPDAISRTPKFLRGRA
jgi:hypothetical protein